jgi:hypothetical protein
MFFTVGEGLCMVNKNIPQCPLVQLVNIRPLVRRVATAEGAEPTTRLLPTLRPSGIADAARVLAKPGLVA